MKIPPFSKPLKELLQSGQLPANNIYVYIGINSWEKGTLSSIPRPTRTLVLPPNRKAIDYEWPVKDCDILLIETSLITDVYREDVVYVLFKYDALNVTVIKADFSTLFYKKDFSNER